MTPFIERIKKKIRVDSETECWIYLGRIDPVSGYARVGYKGRNCNGHRAVLMEVSGRSPEPNVFACHTCDIRACVNPAHLWWGSRKENQADCGRKGRAALTVHPEITQGERHPAAIFTNKQVLQIRKLLKGGRFTQQEIADKFGCSQPIISNINTRSRWRHL